MIQKPAHQIYIAPVDDRSIHKHNQNESLTKAKVISKIAPNASKAENDRLNTKSTNVNSAISKSDDTLSSMSNEEENDERQSRVAKILSHPSNTFDNESIIN